MQIQKITQEPKDASDLILYKLSVFVYCMQDLHFVSYVAEGERNVASRRDQVSYRCGCEGVGRAGNNLSKHATLSVRKK